MHPKFWLAAVLVAACTFAEPGRAGSIFVSTGDADGKMAMASWPLSAGKIEIEAADDFILASPSNITRADFHRPAAHRRLAVGYHRRPHGDLSGLSAQ